MGGHEGWKLSRRVLWGTVWPKQRRGACCKEPWGIAGGAYVGVVETLLPSCCCVCVVGV